MKETYLIYVIPFVILQTVFGQDLEFSRTSPFTTTTKTSFFVDCYLGNDNPSRKEAVYKWYTEAGDEITSTSYTDQYYILPMVGEGGLSLMIGDVVSDDAGVYRCDAVANEVSYSKTFTLNVKASITFRDCGEEQFGVLGEVGRITCAASAGGVYVKNSWAKSGYVLEPGDKYAYETAALKLLKVEQTDAGVYRYQAQTSGQFAELKFVNIKYEVVVAPQIVNPILATTAIVGKDVTLYCTASGTPRPTINWYKVKDGTEDLLGYRASDSTDRIKIGEKELSGNTQGDLQILNVVREDAALYRCKAKNKANNDGSMNPPEVEAYLTVHTPPTIETMEDATGTEGSSKSLECRVHGDPAPVLIWIKQGSSVQYSAGSNIGNAVAAGSDISEPNNPGSALKLTISNLEAADAGVYFCNASNPAGTASQTVNLAVEFSPNFENQPTTEYYNWANYADGSIDCVVNGNPLPVFSWFKGDTEITTASDFYGISRIEPADDAIGVNRYRVTSKLSVGYNGANEQVFGDYKCEATNKVDKNEILLTMTKAQAPGEPQVIVRDEGATQYTFWLYDALIKGPEVTDYRITYKIKGSATEGQVYDVRKEAREQIDTTRRYTVAIVTQLGPNQEYVFTFMAKNQVGFGPGKEMTLRTQPIRPPDVVSIGTPYNSPFSTRINLIWTRPKDGGSDILYYTVTYQQVEVKNMTSDPTQGYQLERVISDEITRDKLKDETYTLEHLIPGQFYQIKVYATNGEGAGTAGLKIIKTKMAPLVAGASTGQKGLSTGAIIGIVVAIFFLLFIIVDVTCYFTNKCGILMSIKEKVSGGHGDDGYSAAKTDDVENLAKKDELTEEAKAVEEGELAQPVEDEKKEPLLSEEQKVDTVDEVDVKPEMKEVEPEEKDMTKPESPVPDECPKIEPPPPLIETPAAPAQEPVPAPTPAVPVTEEKPPPETV